jgi:hypothetical protein
MHAGGTGHKEDEMVRKIVTLCVAVVLLSAGVALTQDKPPDATVQLKEGSVALGVGYSWGSGTLNYKGRSYPLKVKGLSIGQVGASKIEATGKVFNLAKLEDFSGNYTAAGVEATVAGGAGASALRNQNGVVIHLTSTTRGLNFKVAPEGVQLTLAQ